MPVDAKGQPSAVNRPRGGDPGAVEGVVTPALSIRNVSQTYGNGRGRLLALDRVDLEVQQGEFLCLVGASGCGKSTLLNLIAGLYSVTQGEIDTHGHRVGLMFQESALFPWLTVEDNVGMPLRLRGVDKAHRVARVRELLDVVHLGAFAQRRPHELSGGMRQRVSLARALAQDADVLLMDEPFGALDAMTRDLLHDEIESIWQKAGLTVLFVTHNVREAARLGDRVVLLSSRPGRVAATFDVPLARPRRLEAGDVSDLTAEITDALRREVRRHGR